MGATALAGTPRDVSLLHASLTSLIHRIPHAHHSSHVSSYVAHATLRTTTTDTVATSSHKPSASQVLSGGLLGCAGISVLLVGRALGMARYFVLQLSGQLGSSAALQAVSEALSGASPTASDLALQVLR